MTQGRSYNPLLKSYPDSEKINSVSEGAETLYTRLLAVSDDHGCYWGSPIMVMSKLYAHRAEKLQVNEMIVSQRLEELEQAELIRRYEVDGRIYLRLLSLYRPLRPDREPKSIYPMELESGKPVVNHGDTGGKPPVCPNPSYNPTQTQHQPTSTPDGVLRLLLSIGVGKKNAPRFRGIPSAHVVAEWSKIRRLPAIRNPVGLLLTKLENLNGHPPEITPADVVEVARLGHVGSVNGVTIDPAKLTHNAGGVYLDGRLILPAEKLAGAEYA